MKKTDLDRVATAVEKPMKDFVREARVRTALLVNQAGQVLAQHGFSRGFDAVNVAALAAAAHASSHALAEITGAGHWMHMHHAGEENQLFLAPFRVGTEEMVLVTIFDETSTLGLVQLFFDRLVENVRELPDLQQAGPGSDPAALDDDLAAGIQRVLGDRRER